MFFFIFPSEEISNRKWDAKQEYVGQGVSKVEISMRWPNEIIVIKVVVVELSKKV